MKSLLWALRPPKPSPKGPDDKNQKGLEDEGFGLVCVGEPREPNIPLIKEYGLNYIGLRLYSLVKGYWALWEVITARRDCRPAPENPAG